MPNKHQGYSYFESARGDSVTMEELGAVDMSFKDAVFFYEVTSLPPELRVIGRIAELFRQTPESATTLVEVCCSLEQSAPVLDDFKAKSCGSPFSLAVINLNNIQDVDELGFLLRRDVLGNPRTIFLASLRGVKEEVYAYAKEKVFNEAEDKDRVPSCIDFYSPTTTEQLFPRISELACAYLREAEDRIQAKKSGRMTLSPAQEVLKKHTTVFSTRKSGVFRPGTSGIFNRSNNQ